MMSFRLPLPCSRTELASSLAAVMTCCACAAGGGQGETTVTQTAQPGSGTTATPSTPVTGAAPSSPDGPMFNPADLEPTDECDGNLPVVYRDFSQAHPDFEMGFRGDVVRRQLVEPTLGTDGKPVFKSSVGCPAKLSTPTECETWSVSQTVITSASSFNQWYRDTPGMNVAFEKVLELTDAGNGLYKYNSTDFFPIGNDQGFGITPPGQQRNFLFTTEVHVTFEYVARQTFSFRGDDDMWIFVNKRLALDLGSMHGSEPGVIDFDKQAADLGIVVGRAYPMDIFHAERHTSASNFGVETNIACFTPSIVR
jgi:fibro-slime domain-containing protein